MFQPVYFQNKTNGYIVKLILETYDGDTAIYVALDGPQVGRIKATGMRRFLDLHYRMGQREIDLPCEICGRKANGKRPKPVVPHGIFKA